MNFEEFKNQLITEGIASIHKNEHRPAQRRGALAGFELCRGFNSPWDFQDELKRRQKQETDMISLRTLNEEYRKGLQAQGIPVPQGEQSGTMEEYWEHRYGTLQIQYVYERMLVVWSQKGLYSGPLSANAVIRAAEIVGVQK